MSLETARVKEERAAAVSESWEGAECVRVKEEPVSELYDDAGWTFAEEAAGGGVSAAAARAGLYAGHDVKGELVLGPERLQPPDTAYARPPVSKNIPGQNSSNIDVQRPVEHQHPQMRCVEQLQLWACSVRLERIATNKKMPGKETMIKTVVNRQNHCENKTKNAPVACVSKEPYNCATGEQTSHVPVQRKNADVTAAAACGGKEASTRSAAHRPTTLASHGDQLGLRACSVRLARLPAGRDHTGRGAALATSRRDHTGRGAALATSRRDHTGRSAALATSRRDYTGRSAALATSRRDYTGRGAALATSRRDYTGRGAALATSRRDHTERGAALATSRRDSYVGQITGVTEVNTKENYKKQSWRSSGSKLSTKPRSSCNNNEWNKPKVNKSKILTEQFSQKLDLVVEHEQTHNGKKPLKCSFCFKKFPHKSNLVSHVCIHTGEKPFKCDICLKQFAHKSTLREHKRIHTGEQLFKCEICLKQFAYRRAFLQHKDIHSLRKQFKCDYCLKEFTQRRYLIQHKQIHSEKKIKCEECLKQFTQMSYLIKHQKVHSRPRQKPFKCEICSKRFTKMETLKGHAVVHTGETPHKCDICLKQFKYRRTITHHLMIHAGVKPHKCEFCVKRFTKKAYLVEHERIHTGEKPYKCDVCSRQFAQKPALRGHMRRHAPARGARGQRPSTRGGLRRTRAR